MMPHPDVPLILHHGTTLRAANAILEVGWQPLNAMAILDRVAAEHGLSTSEIVNDLGKFGRYVLGEDRGAWASFAPSLAKAEHNWAQRAPEAEWEALWAVYRRKYMSSAEAWHWNNDVAGHAWVWDQMVNEPLAVVSFMTSYSEIVALGAFRHGFQRRPLPIRDLLMRVWYKLAEIGFDLPFRPDLERLTVSPVERHLPWDVYAHKLGLTPDEFQRCADSGDFGRPASENTHCQDPSLTYPWWNSATAPVIADKAGINESLRLDGSRSDTAKDSSSCPTTSEWPPDGGSSRPTRSCTDDHDRPTTRGSPPAASSASSRSPRSTSRTSSTSPSEGLQLINE